jgi:pyruvate,orthophosphate dikinase
VKMAAAKGRNTRPNLKVGICGEHGGDPESVKFCHKIGLNYVSCSPFRLLTARLAAAQAARREATRLQRTAVTGHLFSLTRIQADAKG